jgi:hypothetical protein
MERMGREEEKEEGFDKKIFKATKHAPKTTHTPEATKYEPKKF